MNSIEMNVFMIMETVLYLSFLSLDINSFYSSSAYVKYGSICVLFLFVLLKSMQKKKSMLIPVALGFSVFADFFLLFSSNYIPGLLSFLIVQILLFLRIHKLFSIPLKNQSLLSLSILILGITTFVVFSISMDEVSLLAIIYFLLFLSNVTTVTFKLRTCSNGKSTSIILFSIGLFLFFLCDIHVGLNNISGFNNTWVSLAMWLFYLPGQMLIGISNLVNDK